MKEKRKPQGAEPDDGVNSVAGAVAGEVASGIAGRVWMLVAVFMMAFASVFLLIGWQFGPLVMLQAQQYKKMTGHVDARIVESWLALEFDAGSVKVPHNWRASTKASGCVVAEYDGEWGAALRRAFCGTRVPFNDSYLLADLRDISPGVAFAWPRDERGFVVPEIRVDPSTMQWLKSHEPNRFMHDKWPAKTLFDWLRLELDRPLDAAIYGWTAPPSVLPLRFDPSRPAEALPAGIIEQRLAHGPNPVAMLVGFGIGLFIWFKAMAFIPLLSNLAPWGRWVLSALPLLTLPWWMDVFPQALAHFNREIASIVGDVFGDVSKTDRLIASEPMQATLATGSRIVWRMEDSVYLDTFGQFKFVPPKSPLPTPKAAQAAVTETITAQTSALDDAARGELFAKLRRDKDAGLDDVGYVFKPAAEATTSDAAASTATRRAASRFLR